MWSGAGLPEMEGLDRVLRRTFDVLIALVALLAAAPVMAVASLAIIIFSPGSPIFTQRRVGRHQRVFMLYKLRTMQRNGDDLLARYFEAHPEERGEWTEFARLKRDPRLIPTVGRLLRRFSVDELPQLINVIAGDMSLVGPRPLEPHVAERLTPSALAERSQVPPGLTGLWQTSGRSDMTIAEMADLDCQYLRTRSWRRDLAILAQTPAVVIAGRGAY